MCACRSSATCERCLASATPAALVTTPMGAQVGRPRLRPIVRVDGWLLFPDGSSRLATDDENRRLDAGEQVFIDPRSGQRTRLVGEPQEGE